LLWFRIYESIAISKPIKQDNAVSQLLFFCACFDRTSYLTSARRHLVGDSLGTAAVTLLGDGELDTLALGEGNPRLLLSNDENVGLTGSENVVNGI
jgi:hypothetical protein